MSKKARQKIGVTGAGALLLIATCALCITGPAVDASPAPIDPDSRNRSVCEQYTYTSCPDRCMAVCTPTSCGPHSCTTDCDGPGSCLPR